MFQFNHRLTVSSANIANAETPDLKPKSINLAALQDAFETKVIIFAL